MIGAGKSTLAAALAQKLNLPVYYEPVTDNTYLEDFYKDRKKYGFAMQVYLLNARFKQQQEIIWGGKGGVQDRSIYEDSIFAKVSYIISTMLWIFSFLFDYNMATCPLEDSNLFLLSLFHCTSHPFH